MTNPTGDALAASRRGRKGTECIRVDGDVCVVELTQGRFALISICDFDVIAQAVWAYRLKGVVGYCYASIKSEGGVWRTVEMHRFIMKPEPGEIVDHINGDGLDNRRENLRIVNSAQNCMNKKVRSDSLSGVKGVYFNKKKKVWTARLKVDGKEHRLGHFTTLEAAASAHREAMIQFHGEYARLT